MVNITRQKLMNQIYRDYGDDANFMDPGYLKMAIATFYKLLGMEQGNVATELEEQIGKICKMFVDQLRKKWANDKRVQRHLVRLEKYHGPWLKRQFTVRYLDEVSKTPVEEEKSDDEEGDVPEQPPFVPTPTPQPGTSPEPPPSKKRKTFSDMVSDIISN